MPTTSNTNWYFESLDKATLLAKSNNMPPPPELLRTCIIEPEVVRYIVGLSPTPSRLHPNKVQKLVAFVCIEGPIRTVRKVRDALLLKKMESEETFVVVTGKLYGTNQWCTACGRQYTAWQTKMLFRQEMIFPAVDNMDATALAEELINYFQENSNLLKEILEFNQYSLEQAPIINIRCSHVKDAWCKNVSPIRSAAFQKVEDRNHKLVLPLIQIGGGGYPHVYTLPSMYGHKYYTLIEYNPTRARIIGKRYGFKNIETDYRRVLKQVAYLEKPTVIVASYHSQHADIAVEFLQANPQAGLFIEKPPVIGYKQFEKLLPYIRDDRYFVEVGYNRRYIKMVRHAAELLKNRQSPVFVTCIVREDDMTSTHWNFWQTEGTRIHANLCHWIDLGVMLTNCRPIEIVCISGKDFEFSSEVSIRFEDDSVVNLVSGVIGNGLRGVQEYIDIRTDYLTIKIDDFLKMTVLKEGRKKVYRTWPRKKGHDEMYSSFSANCLSERKSKYQLKDFVRSCILTEEICRMFKEGERHRMVDLNKLKAWEESVGL